MNWLAGHTAMIWWGYLQLTYLIKTFKLLKFLIKTRFEMQMFRCCPRPPFCCWWMGVPAVWWQGWVLDCDCDEGICLGCHVIILPITPFSFLSNQNKPNQTKPKGLKWKCHSHFLNHWFVNLIIVQSSQVMKFMQQRKKADEIARNLDNIYMKLQEK